MFYNSDSQYIAYLKITFASCYLLIKLYFTNRLSLYIIYVIEYAYKLIIIMC